MTPNLPLPFDADAAAGAAVYAADEQARAHASDPTRNVVLEASAGTGKTRVLVHRYVNLLRAGVDPANILAMTFTRKAAAEMRERILQELRGAARLSPADAALWRDIRDRAGDIAISTIDAFCLSLLREFPLEADLDPGFDMADDTEVPRLAEEALDRALRISREVARSDEDVKLVFAQLGETRLRTGLASLLDRRLVAAAALGRLLASGPRDLTADLACARAVDRLRALFLSLPGGPEPFLEDGPIQHRSYALFARDVRMLCEPGIVGGNRRTDAAAVRAALNRIRAHFLKIDNTPRKKFGAYGSRHCLSVEAWRRHLESVVSLAPSIGDVWAGFRRDLNVVLSRGVWRVLGLALSEYRRTLEAHAVLDFSELLIRALDLLEEMDEFARSRYRLEARYHHVLVDEFQDTSRAQWDLVSLLIRSWGEGLGLTQDAPLYPTIFIVGDRKQSIYGFRDADVAVLDEAGQSIDRLRPEGETRRWISRSFRAVPALLAFTNDLFGAIEQVPTRNDAFRYEDTDRFPLPAAPDEAAGALGIVAANSARGCAEAVAAEVQRLIEEETVRDRHAGVSRAVRPGDIAILFRSRESHREFEAALEARNLPTYVYKGLGFFDADEIKDVVALLRYLADPESNTRAAAFLRSRFIRLSDPALHALAPNLAAALRAPATPAGLDVLDDEDRRVLAQARASVAEWLSLVDRIPPADLLERVFAETAYAYEIRGPRMLQARENLKKVRAMIRRVQNRGYVTLGRIAEHLDRLSAGDESNAVIDAVDAINLMTVHAAKGLEFPIVFVVNLTKGTGGHRPAIRVGHDGRGQPWVSVGEFLSEADQDVQARDREETKRLLYVAVTRARDRLFLSSVLNECRWKPAKGSLAEVLPAFFGPLFLTACGASARDGVEWMGNAGRRHRLRVCPVVAPFEAQSASPAWRAPRDREGEPRVDDFSRLQDSRAVPRIAVTAAVASASRLASERASGAVTAMTTDSDQALVGTLVHRLFEHEGAGLGGAEDLNAVAAHLRVLARDEEIVGVDDVDEVVRWAAQAYIALCSQPGVASDLSAGEAWFEVPFSVKPAGQQVVLRGTFDCLVKAADGRIIVLEFKTGSPTAEHQPQLDAYLTAARALFPDAIVEGNLVYARRLPLHDRPLDT